MCSDKRQEFILLSDTLGVSMVVDLINHRKPEGATESTVFGPFHRAGAPELPRRRQHRTPRYERHADHRLGPRARPRRQADRRRRLDVWQADSSGLYDSQDPEPDELHMRGKFRTDEDGRFLIRTVPPVELSDSDGRPGRRDAARRPNRHPWRPAHIHFVVSAEGYEPVTTHIFDAVDPYLEVRRGVRGQGFADRATFVRHDVAEGEAARFGLEPPFCTAQFDFVLKQSSSAENGRKVLVLNRRIGGQE